MIAGIPMYLVGIWEHNVGNHVFCGGAAEPDPAY